MENYENIYNSICRLCLSYSDSKKMVSLIDGNSQDSLTPYAKAVSTFAHIGLIKRDSFPSNMCLKCLHLLKQAIHFKLVTESSNNCLKQLKNSVGSDNENLKEKIVEFTMLKFYFPTECFKMTRNCPNTEKKNRGVFHDMKNSEKKTGSQLISNITVDDDIFDTPSQESDPDHDNISQSDFKVLDKIEKLIGHNDVCEVPMSVKKVYRRKNKVAKRKCLKARVQYKLAIKQKRKQKQDFVCSVCKRVLANQLTYNHHMQRHTGFRYICEHCGKGFPVLSELQAHQVTKHDISLGPYLQCTHCPFKAPRKFDLIEHERIHSGERPYTCDKCGLTFRRRGIWKKHLVHHSEKKIQCPQCPRKFFQRSDLLAHANNVHERVYVYSCSKCCTTYAKTETVRRHMTDRHGIPREKQGKIIRVNKGTSYQEY